MSCESVRCSSVQIAPVSHHTPTNSRSMCKRNSEFPLPHLLPRVALVKPLGWVARRGRRNRVLLLQGGMAGHVAHAMAQAPLHPSAQPRLTGSVFHLFFAHPKTNNHPPPQKIIKIKDAPQSWSASPQPWPRPLLCPPLPAVPPRQPPLCSRPGGLAEGSARCPRRPPGARCARSAG